MSGPWPWPNPTNAEIVRLTAMLEAAEEERDDCRRSLRLEIARTNELEDRIDVLEGLLGEACTRCVCLHHPVKDRHDCTEPCPVQKRLRGAIGRKVEEWQVD